MNILRSAIIFLIIFFVPVLAQQTNQPLDQLNKQFQSFDYQTVIKIADSLLLGVEDLNNSEKVEINRIKGISHYSLLQMRLALISFINILELNPNYKMNPIQNSPKIIKYFDEIKENLKNNIIYVKEEENDYSTLLINQRTEINTAIRYSLLLPGLGHLHSEKTTKGWALISATFATLGSSIYFIIDTKNKENDYLNESAKSLIDNKYNKYNDAYNLRNISLLSFAAVWIYAQLDLLVFDASKADEISLNSSIGFNSPPQLKLQIRF